MTDIHAVIAELKALEAKATPMPWADCIPYDAQRGPYNFELAGKCRDALPQLLAYIDRLEAAAKSLDEVTEVLAANDKGPGSGWFAPCLGRARKALKDVGH